MKRVLVLAYIVGFTASLASGCTTCTETVDRSVTVPVTSATSVRILAEAGSLLVQGTPGLTEITAHGTACARSENHLDQLQFVTRTSGSEIVIEARPCLNSPGI